MNRLAWLGAALVAAATLVTARWLEPAPTGLGTHVALGLPPCGFLTWTGLPCATCGLTTGFARLARGDVLGALHAHALSVPLFLGVLALLAVALRGLVRGRSPWAELERVQGWLLLLVLGLLTTWLARLAA